MNGDGKAISICNIGITKMIYHNKSSFAFNKLEDNILINDDIKPLDIIATPLSIYSIMVSKKDESIFSTEPKPLEINVKDGNFSKNPILEEYTIMAESMIKTKDEITMDKLIPLDIFVDTIIPPTNSGSSNGDGLKSFKIVTQKNNYFEFRLNLEDSSVVNITGLPYGVSYVDGVLKGSAQISGEFLITVTLSNNSTINGTLIISQLPRKF